MTKGADSILLPRCNFQTKEDQAVESKTKEDLYNFAVEGLRTLAMGKRSLTKEEYNDFAKEFQRIKTSGSKDKDE